MARHWSEGGSATVGRLLLAAIARGARTAAVMGELADRRTALSREYQFADGSRKVEVYLEPINYEDASGIWQHMGEKLSVSKRAGFALENQTNIFATYLGGGDSRGTVKIEEGSLSYDQSARGTHSRRSVLGHSGGPRRDGDLCRPLPGHQRPLLDPSRR